MSLRNVLFPGVEVIHEAEIPINADWHILGEITAYDFTKKQVTVKSVFDESGAPKEFFAMAKYLGKPGTPITSDVVVGEKVTIYRVGEGNDPAPVGGYSGFKGRSTDTTKASFVAFFFKNLKVEGIPCFCQDIDPVTTSALDSSKIVISPREVEEGETWVTTGLKRKTTISITTEDGNEFFVNNDEDARDILALSSDTFSVFRNQTDCEEESDEKIYSAVLAPGFIEPDGTDVWVYMGESTLSAIAECCEE